MQNVRLYVRGCMLAASILVLNTTTPVRSEAADNFYAGKQVVISVGSAAGGGYDAQARLMARHIGKYIPGNPTVIVQNRPGAGGLLAANHLFNIAPKDGTAIALLQRSVITAKQLIPDNVNFEASRFSWLGSLASEPGVLMVWHTSAVKSAQDLLKRQLIVGGAGVANDSELTSRVLNAVIGAKLKIVPGYQSVGAVMLAMERGEVEGLADWSWSNARRNPHYLNGSARVIMQLAPQRLDELKDVPTPFDFATGDADSLLLSLYLSPKLVARPVALPPGVPEDQLATIRKAFANMTRDPAFLADAEKIGSPIDAVSHEGMRDVIAVVQKASPDVVTRLRAIMAEQ